ncbi:hypothetical protein [Streptomyces sp. NPDC056883]|uniref:hypothetical protein n=1 Tax=Streptomyces sp. NPDC056883 TaxID=3345959 RepID=UPI0036A5724D
MHKLVSDEVGVTEDPDLHYERWRWGGRLPSESLRRARESNVLGLLDFDSNLVHDLGAADPAVLRAVAVLAAQRACEVAGLADVPWVAGALAALTQGHPLPPPFDDAARMREALESTPLEPGPDVLGAVPPQRGRYFPPLPEGLVWVKTAEESDGETSYRPDRLPGSEAPMVYTELVFPAFTPQVRGPISQPHSALPAVRAAAEPDPLKAALDAVWDALGTYGEHYPKLLDEIRSVWGGRISVPAAKTGPADLGRRLRSGRGSVAMVNYRVKRVRASDGKAMVSAVSYDLPSAEHRRAGLEAEGATDIKIVKVKPGE